MVTRPKPRPPAPQGGRHPSRSRSSLLWPRLSCSPHLALAPGPHSTWARPPLLFPSWLLEKLSGWDSVPPGAPYSFVLVLQRTQSSFPLSLSRGIFIEILTKGVGWGSTQRWGPTQVPRRFNAATLGPAGLALGRGKAP